MPLPLPTAPQLTRYHPRELHSSSGLWLVRGYGLGVSWWQGQWRIQPSDWYDPRHALQHPAQWHRLSTPIRRWLARSGLDQARFVTRRQALQALEWACATQPPDWLAALAEACAPVPAQQQAQRRRLSPGL